MGNQALISLITPVYNTSRSCLETLAASVFSQNHQSFEWIVVDDGSNSETAEVLDGLAASDTRMVVIHIPNGGISHARNTGLAQAKGSYVAFVDSDDVITPNYLSSALSFSEELDSDMVCGRSRRVYPDRIVEISFVTEEKVLVYEGKDLDDLARFFVIGFPAIEAVRMVRGMPAYQVFPKLYRRSLIEQIHFNEGMTFCEDSLFCLEAVCHAHRVALVDEAWHDYMIRADSISGATRPEDFRRRLEQFDCYVQAASSYNVADYDLGLRYFRYIRSSLVPLAAMLSLRELSNLVREIYTYPHADLIQCIDFSRYDLPSMIRVLIVFLKQRNSLGVALWLKLRNAKHGGPR